MLILAYIGISSFIDIDKLLQQASNDFVQQSKTSVEHTTNLAIDNSIKALDKKSKLALEDKSVFLAKKIADFLYQRDKDILFLSKLNISQNLLKEFYIKKQQNVFIPQKYIYNPKKGWIPANKNSLHVNIISVTTLDDNQKEFHKIIPSSIQKRTIPIYKEITFYLPNGDEIYKISNIDPQLKNISNKQNTYLKAETYFQKAKILKEGEIYVSPVIGEYIPSPIIGAFTKEKAKKAGITFEPQKYAYAGKENPVGKKFEGIIRFVTPVYKNGNLQGYLTLALDHHHIMDITDFTNPLSPEPLKISDASLGNYAFLWNNNFECISHPRDYFIIGYDPKTGKKVPGWIDSKLAQKFQQSNFKDLNTFLHTQPIFDHQSLKKKPNLSQLRIGQVGLDCRYLNFAPQCQGWSELVGDGGYGSFVIYWSKVWKLTVAAAIPYYTGDYGKSKIGFGFVTIGANVSEFHKAATQTKEHIDTLLKKEYTNLSEKILSISKTIFNAIQLQIKKMSIITLILIIVVIYVAIMLSNYISSKIQRVLIGTKKLKEANFDYKIPLEEKDEFGTLIASFNEMAQSINNLKKDLESKIYTDELTHIQNRQALSSKLRQNSKVTIILLDIDNFKNINDFYGSETGNTVLIHFAHILKDFLQQKNITPYRIGSDDYAVLIPKILNKQEIEEFLKALLSYIQKQTFSIDKLNIDIKVSFTSGVALNTTHLIEKADIALNFAKKRNKLFVIYDEKDPSMNKQTEFILWRDKISYALEHDNIIPFYQPIIDVKNPENKKYEVLMRLHEGDNYYSPVLFLDIAKESKLYPKLTKTIIQKAFKKLQNLDAIFTINLSVIDMSDEETKQFIYNNIDRYNVGEKIVFEILETEEIENFDLIKEFLEEVREKGVRLAIDDFGSGYSNFSYFSILKPDFLKIDGSLIKNIQRDTTQYHIVEAIVKFAKALDIELVAEFVSTKETYEVLLDFDIDYMQGYYLGEPQKELS